MKIGDKDRELHTAQYIEGGFADKITSKEEAQKRAWAILNKMHAVRGGGFDDQNKTPREKAGEKGSRASARRPASERSASAKKAAETRKKNQT